ncbi:MAG: hypothetical protein U0744_07055 [Gemmataceae bacterium]
MSQASNTVGVSYANGLILIYDRDTGTNVHASRPRQWRRLSLLLQRFTCDQSGDGRYVAFESRPQSAADRYRYNRDIYVYGRIDDSC